MDRSLARKLAFILFVLAPTLLVFAAPSHAMPVKTEIKKTNAFLKEAGGKIFEPLDLKVKTLSTSNHDLDQCGANLVRRAQSLTYSCTLAIPGAGVHSKLHSRITPERYEILWGGAPRLVRVDISPDAKSITWTTSFDMTGLDIELSRFNDDFFLVFNKAAHNVLSEAMKFNRVRFEVLEGSNPTKAAQH